MTQKKKWLSFILLGLVSFQASFSSNTLAQDLIPPDNVTNVTAEAGNESATIKWDTAYDPDGEVIGYKIYYGTQPVTAENGNSYEDEIVIDSVNDNEYKIENLVNGVTYYFAMTAIDDEEEESANYSLEVSVTPESSSHDMTLAVVSAEPVELKTIKVTMSDSVQVASTTDSFIVENVSTDSDMTILDTKIEGEVVTLVLAENQQQGQTYNVLAMSSVSDLQGNPVSSGITDHYEYRIPDNFVFKEPTPEIQPEPENNQEEETEIYWGDEDDGGDNTEIEINNQLENTDNTDFKDVVSNEIESNNNTDLHTSASTDTTAPESASNISIGLEKLKGEGVILASWTPASDADLIDQVLYIRENGVDWGDGYPLGAVLNEVELEVEKGTNYELKIVSIDKSGNKSTSEIQKFSTKLSESGGSSMISLFIALLIGGFALRRRFTRV
jgi:hypothetical protein